MSFSMVNFKDTKIQTKIQAVIMDRMNKEPITNYHDLTQREQKKFKILQNEYLNSAPFKTESGDWEEQLTSDFNEVTYDFLHGKKNYLHMVDTTIHEPEMVFRNDEERENFKKTEKENFARFVEYKRGNKTEEGTILV